MNNELSNGLAMTLIPNLRIYMSDNNKKFGAKGIAKKKGTHNPIESTIALSEPIRCDIDDAISVVIAENKLAMKYKTPKASDSIRNLRFT